MHPKTLSKHVDRQSRLLAEDLRKEMRTPDMPHVLMRRESIMRKIRPLVLFLTVIGRTNDEIVRVLARRGIPAKPHYIREVLRSCGKSDGIKSRTEFDRKDALVALCELLPPENVDPALRREFEEIRRSLSIFRS